MSFFRYLKNELFCILHNRRFLVILLILLLLSVFDGLDAYRTYSDTLAETLACYPKNEEGVFLEYPYLQIYTLYNSWLGGRPNKVIPLIYFYTMPAFVAIPYSWSHLQERKTGYIRNVVTKIGKRAYFLGKYISAFCSGFLTVVLPLLFSLGFISCLVPAYRPNVTTDLYYQVGQNNMYTDLYFSHPLLTAFLNIGIVGLFSGLWATVPYTVSFFTNNRFVAVFAPYLELLFLLASAERALVFRSPIETSIIEYIMVTASSMVHNIWVFVGEMLILLAVPFIVVLGQGRRSNVF